MHNINEIQKQLLEKLESRVKNLEIRWHEERGVAAVLQGQLLPAARIGADPVEEPQRVLKVFLSEVGPLVGPELAADFVRFVSVEPSKLGHVRIRAMQLADKIPIHGATLLLFADSERGVFRVQSGLWRDVVVPPLVDRGVPVDPKDRAAALKKRLEGILRESRDGHRFIERKFKEGFGDDQAAAENFPLASPPTHWLYPTEQGLRHVFRLYAYQPVEWLGVDGEPRKTIELADMVVDLLTGQTLRLGARLGAWTDVTADGLSTLQQSGSYITRPLQAVRENGGARLLVNRTRSPHVITHDANGTEVDLETKFKNDTGISNDADGHWNDTTTSCTSTDRRDAQQSETDGHFFADQAMQHYGQFGWDGFDDGRWGTTPCIVRVAAHIGMDANAYFWRYIENNRHYGYVAFYDGKCSGTTLDHDFMAGDPAIFAHEYQHAVTYFGAVDSAGNPGYLEINNWHRAIHEGLSDAVGGLRSGLWVTPGLWPAGACRNNAPFRRIEYPRSTATKDAKSYCDHYDDRVAANAPYSNSTILSHAIYLAGQGGVHQRLSRPAQLIPVVGAGLQTISEIVHHAVTQFFDNIPPNSDGSKTMVEAANMILDAAEQVTGSKRSCAYVILRRAFYAVGLFPYDSSYNLKTYGGEVCMLPWTYSWRFSQPYIGLPALWWKSPDLFINNNGTAEYNAVVSQENNVFARVRNIGDQVMQNVRVRFFFSPMGTNLPPSVAGWHPCKNLAGVDCVLDIPTLAAGSMNFTNVNNPPANQAVHWYLDPAFVTSQVDHFCLRAVIECEAENHNHDCPNQVQSNIQYQQLNADETLDVSFVVANWLQEPKPLELRVTHTLPIGYRIEYVGDQPLRKTILQPRKPQAFRFKLVPPKRKAASLAPPYDGKVVGKLEGKVSGRFVGELSNARGKRELLIEKRLKRNIGLTGMLAGNVETAEGQAFFSGDFLGELDPITGTIRGELRGNVATAAGRYLTNVGLRLEGCLEPLRAVHFAQIIDGEAVGGITVGVRLPRLRRQCIPRE